MELNRKKNPSLKSRENKESLRLDPLEPWVRDSLTFCLIPYKEFRSQPTECLWEKKKKISFNVSLHGICPLTGIHERMCLVITAFTGGQRSDQEMDEEISPSLRSSQEFCSGLWTTPCWRDLLTQIRCVLLPGPIATSLITATNHLLQGPLCEPPHQLPAHTLDCGSRS